jgi:hypothetical protein
MLCSVFAAWFTAFCAASSQLLVELDITSSTFTILIILNFEMNRCYTNEDVAFIEFD